MRPTFLLLLGFLFTPAAAALANPMLDTDGGSSSSFLELRELNIRSDASYTFESDFKDSSLGSLSVTKLNISPRIPVSLIGNLRLQAGFSYRRLDFDSGAGFVPDQMQGLSALIGLEYMIAGKPAIGLLAAPGFYFIDDINGDSFDVPTIFYASWRFTDKFIGIGGANYSSLRPDRSVIPLAGFMWTITDDIKFNAILPVPSLDFTVSDKVTFSVIGEWAGLRVHTGNDLDDDTYDDTSARYLELRAGARVKYNLSDTASLSLSGGWAFRQEFSFEDPDEEFRTDGAPFVGVSFRKTF